MRGRSARVFKACDATLFLFLYSLWAIRQDCSRPCLSLRRRRSSRKRSSMSHRARRHYRRPPSHPASGMRDGTTTAACPAIPSSVRTRPKSPRPLAIGASDLCAALGTSMPILPSWHACEERRRSRIAVCGWVPTVLPTALGAVIDGCRV